MINIKDMTKLIIEEAGRDDYLGKWAEFCRTTGYNRHQVYFWRKKLGLVIRAPAGAAPRLVDGTNECPEQLRGIMEGNR